MSTMTFDDTDGVEGWVDASEIPCETCDSLPCACIALSTQDVVNIVGRLEAHPEVFTLTPCADCFVEIKGSAIRFVRCDACEELVIDPLAQR